MGADPLGHHLSDDGFRRGPHYHPVLEFLAARVGDYRQLRGESLDMLGLTLQVRFRYQEREVGVLVAGVFDPAVQLTLQKLPHAVPVGPHDHGPAHRSPVRQLSLDDELVVPGREVLALRSYSWSAAFHRPRIAKNGWLLGR